MELQYLLLFIKLRLLRQFVQKHFFQKLFILK